MKKFFLTLLLVVVTVTFCSCNSILLFGNDNPLPTENVNDGEFDYYTALEIAQNQFPETQTFFPYMIDAIKCSYADGENVLIEGRKNDTTVWQKQISCRHTEITTMDIDLFITEEKTYLVQDFKLFVFDTKNGEMIENFDMESVTMLTHSKNGQNLFISGPYNDEIFVFNTANNQTKTISIDSKLSLAEMGL